MTDGMPARSSTQGRTTFATFSGDAGSAVGFHTVPNRISRMPTLKSAGVPLIIIYAVMENTASTAKKAQPVKITWAAFSIADLFL